MDSIVDNGIATASNEVADIQAVAVEPMRLAFVASQYPTSGDTFITNQITGLLDRGHDVQIFATTPQANMPRLHEDIVRYKLTERVHYHGRPSKAETVRVIAGDMLRSPVDTGQRLLASRTVKRIDEPTPVLDGYFKLGTFARENPFDLFSVHFGPIANNMLFLKDQYPTTPFVANFHGYDFSSRIRYHGVNYYDQLWKKADLVTTHSYFSRDCLIAIGCPPEKVIKHPLGIDTRPFKYRARRLGADGEIHMGIVARLTEKKSHRIILNAFARLAATHPNVFLHIAGGGELKENIEQQIASDETLRRRVTLHGWMTQNEVAALLDKCHLFVHPSAATMRWAELEDTPTGLIEAQAVGLPVIATYHAGIPEIVLHEKTGLLVPERNEDALLDAMTTLVDHPERWEEMGRAGHEFALSHFDIRLLNARLEWVFAQLKKLPAGTPLGIRSTEELQGIG